MIYGPVHPSFPLLQLLHTFLCAPVSRMYYSDFLFFIFIFYILYFIFYIFALVSNLTSTEYLEMKKEDLDGLPSTI